MDDRRDRVVVLGLGNLLFSDEGVGVHAVAALRRFTFDPQIDLIDGGTMGLDLLPFFQDRDRILIIDAAHLGKQPGWVEILDGDAIRSVLNPKLSVHHVGLADLLIASQFIRERQPHVLLIGIQPESLCMSVNLSDTVAAKLDLILGTVVGKLKEWGIQNVLTNC